MLPMNFNDVYTTFRYPSPLQVFDTTGTYEHGKWVEKKPIARKPPINAVVLALSPAILEFYSHGDASASGIAIHTKATLYFTDPLHLTTENKQSYLDYQEYRYRVIGTGFMQAFTGIHLYHCVRYIS